MTVTERLFRQGNDLHRPFSTAAGVRCRGVSEPLQRIVTDFGADHPFRQVVSKLEEHYGITLPHETIRTVTESHGQQMLEAITSVLKTSEPVAAAGSACVLAEIDGGMVPVVDVDETAPDRRQGKTLKWQELKLCIARDLASATRFYGGTFSGDVDEAGQQWRHCACLAGLGKDTEVHSVGDGATWITNQVEEQFGAQGHYLVDFFHLSEYLAKAAPVCSESPDNWLKQQQTALKNNRPHQVLETLLPFREAASVPDERAPVRKAYRYLRNRKEQVDYASAIEQQRPIGSGEIESAHRFVVQARLKKPGAWWKPDNVDPMFALRVTRLNGGWEDYWKSHQALA